LWAAANYASCVPPSRHTIRCWAPSPAALHHSGGVVPDHGGRARALFATLLFSTSPGFFFLRVKRAAKHFVCNRPLNVLSSLLPAQPGAQTVKRRHLSSNTRGPLGLAPAEKARWGGALLSDAARGRLCFLPFCFCDRLSRSDFRALPPLKPQTPEEKPRRCLHIRLWRPSRRPPVSLALYSCLLADPPMTRLAAGLAPVEGHTTFVSLVPVMQSRQFLDPGLHPSASPNVFRSRPLLAAEIAISPSLVCRSPSFQKKA